MTLTMIGRITDCVLLAYRTPAESIRGLLPPPIEPLTHDGWAFWNIVACRVEAMRPRRCPARLGCTYHHVAYRLYARSHTRDGEIEGLFFVRSEADGGLVCRMGNLFTPFRFHHAPIRLGEGPNGVFTLDVGGGAPARLTAEPGEARLASGSCFETYDQAAKFLKYRPLVLSIDRRGTAVKLAEVFRDETAWHEVPLRVTDERWSFFDDLNQTGVALELATRVAAIEYRWRLGRRRPLWASKAPPCAAMSED